MNCQLKFHKIHKPATQLAIINQQNIINVQIETPMFGTSKQQVTHIILSMCQLQVIHIILITQTTISPHREPTLIQQNNFMNRHHMTELHAIQSNKINQSYT